MILYLLTAVVLLILAVLVVIEIIDYQVEGLHDICEVNIGPPCCQESFKLRII
jgi:hypothetical protein